LKLAHAHHVWRYASNAGFLPGPKQLTRKDETGTPASMPKPIILPSPPFQPICTSIAGAILHRIVQLDNRGPSFALKRQRHLLGRNALCIRLFSTSQPSQTIGLKWPRRFEGTLTSLSASHPGEGSQVNYQAGLALRAAINAAHTCKLDPSPAEFSLGCPNKGSGPPAACLSNSGGLQ
jgi:hypothetical protein